MELFVLYPKTYEILQNLRAGRSRVYSRRDGKTTAILLRAKELIDNGEPVYIACAYPDFMYSQYGMLTGKPRSEAAKELKIVRKAEELRGRFQGTLLVDEPYLLGWFYDVWDELDSRFTVVKAGY